MITVSPVCFPVEFILLKQPSDCMLDTVVPIAGRLEELGICTGIKSLLLVPGHRVLSTDCTFCSLWAMLFWRPPRDLTVSEASGQAAVVLAWTAYAGDGLVPTTGGTERW